MGHRPRVALLPVAGPAGLRAQGNRAAGDVRRAQSTMPAAAVGMLVSGVPMVVILVVAVLRLL